MRSQRMPYLMPFPKPQDKNLYTLHPYLNSIVQFACMKWLLLLRLVRTLYSQMLYRYQAGYRYPNVGEHRLLQGMQAFLLHQLFHLPVMNQYWLLALRSCHL